MSIGPATLAAIHVSRIALWAIMKVDDPNTLGYGVRETLTESHTARPSAFRLRPAGGMSSGRALGRRACLIPLPKRPRPFPSDSFFRHCRINRKIISARHRKG